MRISFQCNPTKWYDVSISAPYTDTYNEQLDSASVIIPHVSDELSACNPYDLCVIDEGTLFRREMMVDSIVFQQRDMNAGGFGQYTIKLMSETKFLEKVQLPNKCFTRDANGNQKTLLEAINELMLTYMPVIRVWNADSSSWTYQQFMTLGILPSRFSTVKLMDIMMSKPTLRQALTAIMSQEGCIPVVNNRQLSCIDFRSSPSSVALSSRDYQNFNWAKSSDSYVTALVSQADDVLDTENEVVREAIGFRDPEKAIISQTSNMFLNTTLPIYKVTRLELNWNGTYSVDIRNFFVQKQGTYFFLAYASLLFSTDLKNVTCRISVPSEYQQYNMSISFPNMTIVYLNVASDGKAVVTGSINKSGFQMDYVSGTTPLTSYSQISSVGTLPQGTNAIAVQFEASMSTNYPSHETEVLDGYIRYPSFGNGVLDDKESMYAISFDNVSAAQSHANYQNVSPLLRFDITPLVYEASARKLLNTDFVAMTAGEETIKQISQYYYGTLQYQIGGTQITGFSDTYAEAPAGTWWTQTKTHMEVIVEAIFNSGFSGDDGYFSDIFDYFMVPSYYSVGLNNIQGNPISVSGIQVRNFVTDCSFNVAYQPLNKISVRYDKSDMADVPVPIVQLDTKQDGIANMDALSIAETDKCDRLGRPVISFSERLLSYEDAIPLGTVLTDRDNAVVFHREASFENGYVTVNYSASPNYVIQNYSTAIQTKYRAYQYVDYGSAVERKESLKLYALITQDPISVPSTLNTGLWYYSLTTGACLSEVLFPFLSDFRVNAGIRATTQTTPWYANDLSVVSYGSDIVFSMMDFDSASYGLYVTDKPMLGGVQQSWYIMQQDDEQYFGLAQIKEATSDNIRDIALESPKTSIAMTDYNFLFSNPSIAKDVSEKLGFTLQIELSTDAQGIVWTSNLMGLNGSVSGVSYYQTAYADTLSDSPVAQPTSYGTISALTLSNDVLTATQDVTIVAKYNGSWYQLMSVKQGTYHVQFSECRGRLAWNSAGNVFSPVGNKV